MRVVVDANVAVSLVLDPARAVAIAEHWRAWEESKATLHAPSLFRYEVASALTLVLHELREGPMAIAIARQLRWHSAYDASYVALAQRLDTEVWTLDGPLARNAAGSGLPVRPIEAAPSRRA